MISELGIKSIKQSTIYKRKWYTTNICSKQISLKLIEFTRRTPTIWKRVRQYCLSGCYMVIYTMFLSSV